MKKTLTTAIALLSIIVAFGQGAADACLFSRTFYQGSAKALGMSNAMGAVGGDMTSICINPAGMGIYRSNEFTTTLSLMDNYQQSTYYEMSNGAVIFDGDKLGLHTRVFINKEGVPTYEAKDVGLIFTKWDDYHFDKSVVITGSEQLEYMKVVLKSIEQYAPELVEKTTHLTHGLVKLPGGVKMSSRKGNFLKAVDVLNLVKEEFKSDYNSEDEKIPLAATKYAFLKYKMGGNIIFDPKESVKMTGNSGPYLLYSAVRAKKILAKGNVQSTMQPHALVPEEKNLIKKCLEYREKINFPVNILRFTHDILTSGNLPDKYLT